jgi:uncharacterized protein YndB with AHSA1/START domain
VLKRHWFAEGLGHEVELFELDFRAGGTERLHYRLGENSPVPGLLLENETQILDLVEGERIVTASTMAAAGHCISATLVTIELSADGEGSRMRCTHHGAFFEGADGPQMHEMGWNLLFDQLGEALTSKVPA